MAAVSRGHTPPAIPIAPLQVPKTRALSHYSGDTFLKKADYSNLDGRPERMPVCKADFEKQLGVCPWSSTRLGRWQFPLHLDTARRADSLQKARTEI